MRNDEQLIEKSGIQQRSKQKAAPDKESEKEADTPQEGRGRRPGASWSGHERNHLFVSTDGRRFDDTSGVSGLDDPGDSRVASFLDLDRDGRTDIAMVNANAPLLRILRNRSAEVAPLKRGFIALRFVGGNHTATPVAGLSSRDGVGAKARVQVGDRVLLRVRNCGEGFAAQNSATLLIGIGESDVADQVNVTWPSGIVQSIDAVPSGTLLTVYESPDHSPTGKAFVAAAYGPAISIPTAKPEVAAPAKLDLPAPLTRSESRLTLITTMATWCANCRKELPSLKALRTTLSKTELAMWAVPVDPKDDAAKLAAYAKDAQVPYELFADRPQEFVDRVVALGRARLGSDGLPMTIVVDGEGNVLLVRWGAPTVSELKGLSR